MKAVFVTGTDTEVGKTLVCGLLGQYLLDKGRRVVTQKWIQTGSDGFAEDIRVHLRLMGRGKKNIEKYLSFMCPYTFSLAASPHLAAEAEQGKIDTVKIKDSFRRLSEKFDTVIVEGTGGALVPFNRKELVIDIAQELDLPVIIVAKNKLGDINHTLLTIEAIEKRNMKITGIIFNGHKDEDELITNDNPQIVKELTGERILGSLPRLKELDLLHKAFVPIGDNIWTAG
jgi:dethiobiotin synthetase